MTLAQRLGSTYIVCESCKKGEPIQGTGSKFKAYHSHGGMYPITVVPGPTFLSTLLSNGYIDTTDPNQKPLNIQQASEIVGIEKMPFGAPGTKRSIETRNTMLRQKREKESVE